jgi:hypothetical protein
MKKVLFVLLLMVSAFGYSQDTTISALTVDVTNNFIFRGAGLSDAWQIQPLAYVSHTTKRSLNYEFGLWGSFAFDNSRKEIDAYAKISKGSGSFTVTNYMLMKDTIDYDIFDYTSDNVSNAIELSLNYTFNKPLTLSVNTIVWGGDKHKNGDQAYSTYAQASYAFKQLTIFAGYLNHTSYYFYNSRFYNKNITGHYNGGVSWKGKFIVPCKLTLMINETTNPYFNIAFTF